MAAIFAYDAFTIGASNGAFPPSIGQAETFYFLLSVAPGLGGGVFSLAWLVQQRRRFDRFESAAERQYYLAQPPPPPPSPVPPSEPPGSVWKGPVWTPTRLVGPSWINVGSGMVLLGAMAWLFGWLTLGLSIVTALNLPTFNSNSWWEFSLLLLAIGAMIASVGWILHERAIARWLDDLAPGEPERE